MTKILLKKKRVNKPARAYVLLRGEKVQNLLLAFAIKVLCDVDDLRPKYTFFLEGDETEYVVVELTPLHFAGKDDTVIYYQKKDGCELLTMLAGSKNIYRWGKPDPFKQLKGATILIENQYVKILDVIKDKTTGIITMTFKDLSMGNDT